MKLGKSSSLLVFTTVLVCTLAVFDQGVSQMEVPQPVHVKIIPTVDRYPAGGSYSFLLHVTVDEPWHINSDAPLDEFLIPTSITVELPEGLTAGRIVYPPGHMRAFAFSETELSVFEQEFYILGSVAVPSSLDPGTVKLGGFLEYQACNDMLCLPPQSEAFELEMTIVPAGDGYNNLNEEILAQASASVKGEGGKGGVAGRGFGSGGLLITFLLVYLGGLALNLTPCVYPLIPITISYFGGQGDGRTGGALTHAILYVLGMSVTYSILGVFAALTGSLLGQALQNPIVLIFIALVMVGLALSMFGFYEIQVPQFIARGASQAKQGYFGTVFMGLTVGLIAAPCIGPFVLGLMTYVGEKGDPLLGFLMFFVLAMGLGTPFLFLALFSGGINQLPRSGDWMVWVRKVFGIVLLGMALYFLSPLMSAGLLAGIVIVFVVISGLYVGFIEGSGKGRPVFLWVKRAMGIAIMIVGVLYVMPGGEVKEEPAWIGYDTGVLEQAKTDGKTVMIDFYADWCIPCKELDHYTFSDPRVLEFSREMVVVKANLTSDKSPEVIAVKERFGIVGVPTVVFIDRQGNEIEDLRFVGFIDADQLLEKLDRLGLVGTQETP